MMATLVLSAAKVHPGDAKIRCELSGGAADAQRTRACRFFGAPAAGTATDFASPCADSVYSLTASTHTEYHNR